MSFRTVHLRGIMTALGALALWVVQDVTVKLGQAVYPAAANLAVQFHDLPRNVAARFYKPEAQKKVEASVDPVSVCLCMFIVIFT
jgi:hypothetical protein